MVERSGCDLDDAGRDMKLRIDAVERCGEEAFAERRAVRAKEADALLTPFEKGRSEKLLVVVVGTGAESVPMISGVSVGSMCSAVMICCCRRWREVCHGL